jgi:hypothetical protein
MIIKLFGLLDLFSALFILLFHFGAIGIKLPILVIMYLGFKVILYRGDFASILDGAVVVFVIAMLFGFTSTFLMVVALIYLGQKGLFSLIAV